MIQCLIVGGVNIIHRHDSKTISAEDAAKAVGISYITLRRWCSRGASQATEPFVPEGTLSFGKHRIHRFTHRDIVRLREYKGQCYRRGRGRIPRVSRDARQERNAWKNWKRRERSMLGWTAGPSKSPVFSAEEIQQSIERSKQESKEIRAAIRSYQKALEELRRLHRGPWCPKCGYEMVIRKRA